MAAPSAKAALSRQRSKARGLARRQRLEAMALTIEEVRHRLATEPCPSCGVLPDGTSHRPGCCLAGWIAAGCPDD